MPELCEVDAMTDTHMKDIAMYTVTETRVDCDGSCWVPGSSPRPTNLEWSGLPPEVVKLVERAFREGQAFDAATGRVSGVLRTPPEQLEEMAEGFRTLASEIVVEPRFDMRIAVAVVVLLGIIAAGLFLLALALLLPMLR